MKEVIITEVDVGSLGKLLGAANAIIVLIIGAISAVVTTVGVIVNGNYTALENIFISIAIVVGHLIVFPMIAYAFGWLYGAIIALVWNVFMGATNGLDVKTIEKK